MGPPKETKKAECNCFSIDQGSDLQIPLTAPQESNQPPPCHDGAQPRDMQFLSAYAQLVHVVDVDF
jgi:hypothetical protein